MIRESLKPFNRMAIFLATVLCLWLQMGCATTGGAPWTIRCLELNGPNQFQMISQFAQTLKRTPGIRAGDVFVMESSDGLTCLYYGNYLRRTVTLSGRRKMPKKLRADLTLIKQLSDDTQRHYFLQAIPIRFPTPNVGNPAWDLTRVDATYSLQVAIFEPNDEFWEYKEAASAFCQLLREKGYEAYYYHTDASSSVTVSAFGADAVVMRNDGRTYYSEPVIVLQRDELMQHNLLNGKIYYVPNDQGDRVAMPSRLVHTPQFEKLNR